MKTMKNFLSVAALALVGAMMTGCSSDDNFADNQQPENKSNVVTLTTTVSLDDGATTRALTAAGVKTFAAGDKIAVFYKNTSDNTVKAESTALTAIDITNGGKNATFTVTLENPKASGAVRYIYPAAMAVASVPKSTATNADATVNYAALATQDGTLATLASTLDLAIFDGMLTTGAELPSATLENKLAILAVTLKNNDGSSEITSGITGMTVIDGTNNYAVSRSAAAGPIYVAIRPTASANITVTAKDDTKNYTKSLTGKTYDASNGYSVSWKMEELASVSGHELSASAVGEIICSDGKAYDAAYKGILPTGVTAVAKVCYKSGVHGFALALADEGKLVWSTAKSTAEAHTPTVDGGLWKLANKDEWNTMITAAGGYAALRDGFSSVGGTNMLSQAYWSSQPYTSPETSAWYYAFDKGSWHYADKESNSLNVRACLEF